MISLEWETFNSGGGCMLTAAKLGYYVICIGDGIGLYKLINNDVIESIMGETDVLELEYFGEDNKVEVTVAAIIEWTIKYDFVGDIMRGGY